ncbi:hypothetical protein [Halomonas sp.]|uniref:hypothetical protein n=1 Tax=Halomonas sp. TaxID=1486246 RepID=UPI003564557F
MKLSEFGDRELVVTCDEPIFHPSGTGIIGKMGYDDKQRRCAVFFRDADEHYFRKYGGYAVSVGVLTQIHSRGVDTVYIAEQLDDEKRMLEYDIASFMAGTLIAYSPGENSIVEGEQAVQHADDSVYTDKQRVVSDSNTVRVWEWDEFTFHP